MDHVLRYLRIGMVVFFCACGIEPAVAEPVEQVNTDPIDLAAIAALPISNKAHAQVLAHLDLTKPFSAPSQWTLIVVQDLGPYPQDSDGLFDHGPLGVCFVKEQAADCVETYGSADWNDSLYELVDAEIVHAGKGDTKPLLLLKTCTLPGGNGNCDVRTALYAFDAKQGHFTPVFINDLGHNNSGDARFMAEGPIQGDVVVNYQTDDAPYRYWIEVWAPGKKGDYTQIVKYRGHTGYGDGNPIPVTWSEMPEILRRLGYWKPGDPLPIPNLPADSDITCPHPVLRHQEEWCQ